MSVSNRLKIMTLAAALGAITLPASVPRPSAGQRR